MDQDFGSQCSSGCESGWTFYLEHSMYHYYEKSKNVVDDEEEEDDDDGLSMVSDASSGPPHVQQHQEQDCNNINAFNECKKEKIVKEARKVQDLTCYFDDSATSSFFNFSHVGDNQDIVEDDNIILDYSEDHIKSKSRLQDQYGLFDSSVSATQLQHDQLCETFKI